MVDFAGWDMPVQYPGGVISEHLSTRSTAGLFDVSHMGRFVLRGSGVVPFLQSVLSNDVGALGVGDAHHGFIPTATGGAIDDAYVYRFVEDEYLLVVNASNKQKDWDHLITNLSVGADVSMTDQTDELAMVSLQGPRSQAILEGLMERGALPEPRRNCLSEIVIAGQKVLVGRTGYTGEPVCFELILPAPQASAFWQRLNEKGAVPIGLGARDTLRLEAGLPLYGHELGIAPDGTEIPVFSSHLAALSIDFSDEKGDYVGRSSLVRQKAARDKFAQGDFSAISDLPVMCKPIALVSRGVARAGSRVFKGGEYSGWVSSGTAIPYFQQMAASDAEPGGEHALRSIGLALVSSDVGENDRLVVDIRGKEAEAVVVRRHLRVASPYTRPVLYSA